jgi:hypothetical protein
VPHDGPAQRVAVAANKHQVSGKLGEDLPETALGFKVARLARDGLFENRESSLARPPRPLDAVPDEAAVELSH